MAFDAFATEPKPLTQQDGKAAFSGGTMNEVMETCSTVKEAVAFLKRVDLRPLLTSAMLFLADASGDSVIVEGDVFVPKEGDFQVVTNFRQSEPRGEAAQCPRYAAAVKVLKARTTTSETVAVAALSAAAQRGDRAATLYSNLFDLKARTAKLYLFHDYEHPVVLDLAVELKKGRRTLRIPDLFPTNPAFEAYVAVQRNAIEDRVAARKGPTLSAADLERFAGSYEMSVGGPKRRIKIRREETGLFATGPEVFGEAGLRLHSAAAAEFFAVNYDGEVDVVFKRDKNGAVEGFTLKVGGAEYVATRVL